MVERKREKFQAELEAIEKGIEEKAKKKEVTPFRFLVLNRFFRSPFTTN